MENAPDFQDKCIYTQAELDLNFAIGIAFVQSRVSYIFPNSSWKNYSVGTFYKKIKCSYICKYGTDSDKALIENTTRNCARPGRL